MSYELISMSYELNKKRRAFLTCALILLVSTTCLYSLSLCLVSQLHFYEAKNFFYQRYYGTAAGHLKKALHYQPDNYQILKNLGKVYHTLGQVVPGAKQAFHYSIKAKAYYLEAKKLNPLDAETTYGIAREEARLEKLYQYRHPEKKDTPYHALPYFRNAIILWPNSILFHYAIARYLNHHKKTAELLNEVRTLSMIYPPTYFYLKKEPFWALAIKEAVQEGLEQAIAQGIAQREAHTAMSALLTEDKKWGEAISHYQQALTYRIFDNKAENYMHLGRLYLKNGEIREAEEIFNKALDRSASKERDLERLYHIYKNEGAVEELYRFYNNVRHRFSLSYRMDILLARSLIDLKRYYTARRNLIELNQKEPRAEAYYWLARIAQLEKDWDHMELAIQKATVLEPENSNYHILFSQVLKRIKKLKRAEKEAGLAIKTSIKLSAWHFNHRAWIRWARKDYLGAARDWKMAISLSPKKASYYAQAAEAYRMLGDWPTAVDYYKKVLDLDPENKGYNRRFREITHEAQS